MVLEVAGQVEAERGRDWGTRAGGAHTEGTRGEYESWGSAPRRNDR